jgi:cytochrome c551/c552
MLLSTDIAVTAAAATALGLQHHCLAAHSVSIKGVSPCLYKVYSSTKKIAAASPDLTLEALQYRVAHHTGEDELVLILVGRCMAGG